MIKPTTREAFAMAYGVGDYKLRVYADAFIEVINKYLTQGVSYEKTS